MTTTDPFAEAASAAAEEQWTRDPTPGHPLSGPERMNRRIGFTMGAAWARTHLTATLTANDSQSGSQSDSEPTDADALTDRIARTVHVMQGRIMPWSEESEVYKHDARKIAAAVLPIVDAAVKRGQAEAWTNCAHEASALGWLQPGTTRILLDRNPYKEAPDEH